MPAASLTSLQCRIARAALDLGVRDLAEIADISPNTVARLEAGGKMHRRTLDYVRGVLEAQGVVFIDDGATSLQGGQGVRLGQGPLSPYARLHLNFGNLPNHLRDPKGAYDGLLSLVSDYMDIVESEDRQPDAWERLDFNEALDYLDRSDVVTAYVLIWRGITPPDNQSKDYPIDPERVERSARFDLKHFKYRVAALRAKGYLHHRPAASWHRVTVRGSDVADIMAQALMHACVGELLASNCLDAEILHDRTDDKGHVYYFSPQASGRAPATLKMYDARPCPVPEPGRLTRVRY